MTIRACFILVSFVPGGMSGFFSSGGDHSYESAAYEQHTNREITVPLISHDGRCGCALRDNTSSYLSEN
jgi:hypothetical protein